MNRLILATLSLFLLVITGCSSAQITTAPQPESEPEIVAETPSIPTRIQFWGKGKLETIESPVPESISDIPSDARNVEIINLGWGRALTYQSKETLDHVKNEWTQQVILFKDDTPVWRFVALNGPTPKGNIAHDGVFLDTVTATPTREDSSLVSENPLGYKVTSSWLNPSWLFVKYRTKISKSTNYGYYLIDPDGNEITLPKLEPNNIIGEGANENYYSSTELLDAFPNPAIGIWERHQLTCRFKDNGCTNTAKDVLRIQDNDTQEWETLSTTEEITHFINNFTNSQSTQLHEVNAGEEIRYYPLIHSECGGCWFIMPNYLSINKTTNRFSLNPANPLAIFGEACRSQFKWTVPGKPEIICASTNYRNFQSLYNTITEKTQVLEVVTSYSDENKFFTEECGYDFCEHHWVSTEPPYKIEWINTLNNQVIGSEIYTPI
jgi:hypothetical protein